MTDYIPSSAPKSASQIAVDQLRALFPVPKTEATKFLNKIFEYVPYSKEYDEEVCEATAYFHGQTLTISIRKTNDDEKSYMIECREKIKEFFSKSFKTSEEKNQVSRHDQFAKKFPSIDFTPSMKFGKQVGGDFVPTGEIMIKFISTNVYLIDTNLDDNSWIDFGCDVFSFQEAVDFLHSINHLIVSVHGDCPCMQVPIIYFDLGILECEQSTVDECFVKVDDDLCVEIALDPGMEKEEDDEEEEEKDLVMELPKFLPPKKVGKSGENFHANDPSRINPPGLSWELPKIPIPFTFAPISRGEEPIEALPVTGFTAETAKMAFMVPLPKEVEEKKKEERGKEKKEKKDGKKDGKKEGKKNEGKRKESASKDESMINFLAGRMGRLDVSEKVKKHKK